MELSRTTRSIIVFLVVGLGLSAIAAGAWPGLLQIEPQRKATWGSALRPFAKHCSPYSPPPSPKIDDLLKRADRIVLATVRSVRPNPKRLWLGHNVIYTLKVVLVVKGKGVPGEIELAGVKPEFEFPFDPSLLDVTFRHADSFAKADTTADASTSRERSHPADAHSFCEYAPYFERGIKYLLVLPEPYTAVSFEPILTFDDAWLLRVERGYGTNYGLY